LTGAVQARVLSGLCIEQVPKPALKQISTAAMSNLLRHDSATLQTSTKKLPDNLAIWAEDSTGSNLCTGDWDTLSCLAKLVWEGAPNVICDALRHAIGQIIAQQASNSPSVIFDVMQDTCSESRAKRCCSAGSGGPVAKRRKTLLVDFEPCMKEVVRAAALDWAAVNLIHIVRCHEWKKLEPDVFLSLVGALLKKVAAQRAKPHATICLESNPSNENGSTKSSAAFGVGTRVLRNGKVGTILTVDVGLDPPSYTLRMDDGTEVLKAICCKCWMRLRK